MRIAVRASIVLLVLAGIWALAWQVDRVREDTVPCTAVQDGGTLTVVWRGREESIRLPGRALELRATDSVRRRARRQGLTEREMLHRAWLDREELAAKVRGKYVRLAWPEGRGARDARGRLIAEVRTEQGALTASGAHAMGE